MERFRVEGGHRLSGAVRVHCAKNAVLPILAGAILADDPTTVLDCPDIADVSNMVRILQTLGCEVSAQGAALRVAPSSIHSDTMPEDLSKRLRSSVFMLGPVAARFGRADVRSVNARSTCTCRALRRWAWTSARRAAWSCATEAGCAEARCTWTIRAWARRKT